MEQSFASISSSSSLLEWVEFLAFNGDTLSQVDKTISYRTCHNLLNILRCRCIHSINVVNEVHNVIGEADRVDNDGVAVDEEVLDYTSTVLLLEQCLEVILYRVDATRCRGLFSINGDTSVLFSLNIVSDDALYGLVCALLSTFYFIKTNISGNGSDIGPMLQLFLFQSHSICNSSLLQKNVIRSTRSNSPDKTVNGSITTKDNSNTTATTIRSLNNKKLQLWLICGLLSHVMGLMMDTHLSLTWIGECRTILTELLDNWPHNSNATASISKRFICETSIEDIISLCSRIIRYLISQCHCYVMNEEREKREVVEEEKEFQIWVLLILKLCHVVPAICNNNRKISKNTNNTDINNNINNNNTSVTNNEYYHFGESSLSILKKCVSCQCSMNSSVWYRMAGLIECNNNNSNSNSNSKNNFSHELNERKCDVLSLLMVVSEQAKFETKSLEYITRYIAEQCILENIRNRKERNENNDAEYSGETDKFICYMVKSVLNFSGKHDNDWCGVWFYFCTTIATRDISQLLSTSYRTMDTDTDIDNCDDDDDDNSNKNTTIYSEKWVLFFVKRMFIELFVRYGILRGHILDYLFTAIFFNLPSNCRLLVNLSVNFTIQRMLPVSRKEDNGVDMQAKFEIAKTNLDILSSLILDYFNEMVDFLDDIFNLLQWIMVNVVNIVSITADKDICDIIVNIGIPLCQYDMNFRAKFTALLYSLIRHPSSTQHHTFVSLVLVKWIMYKQERVSGSGNQTDLMVECIIPVIKEVVWNPILHKSVALRRFLKWLLSDTTPSSYRKISDPLSKREQIMENVITSVRQAFLNMVTNNSISTNTASLSTNTSTTKTTSTSISNTAGNGKVRKKVFYPLSLEGVPLLNYNTTTSTSDKSAVIGDPVVMISLLLKLINEIKSNELLELVGGIIDIGNQITHYCTVVKLLLARNYRNINISNNNASYFYPFPLYEDEMISSLEDIHKRLCFTQVVSFNGVETYDSNNNNNNNNKNVNNNINNGIVLNDNNDKQNVIKNRLKLIIYLYYTFAEELLQKKTFLFRYLPIQTSRNDMCQYIVHTNGIINTILNYYSNNGDINNSGFTIDICLPPRHIFKVVELLEYSNVARQIVKNSIQQEQNSQNIGVGMDILFQKERDLPLTLNSLIKILTFMMKSPGIWYSYWSLTSVITLLHSVTTEKWQWEETCLAIYQQLENEIKTRAVEDKILMPVPILKELLIIVGELGDTLCICFALLFYLLDPYQVPAQFDSKGRPRQQNVPSNNDTYHYYKFHSSFPEDVFGKLDVKTSNSRLLLKTVDMIHRGVKYLLKIYEKLQCIDNIEKKSSVSNIVDMIISIFSVLSRSVSITRGSIRITTSSGSIITNRKKNSYIDISGNHVPMWMKLPLQMQQKNQKNNIETTFSDKRGQFLSLQYYLSDVALLICRCISRVVRRRWSSNLIHYMFKLLHYLRGNDVVLHNDVENTLNYSTKNSLGNNYEGCYLLRNILGQCVITRVRVLSDIVRYLLEWWPSEKQRMVLCKEILDICVKNDRVSQELTSECDMLGRDYSSPMWTSECEYDIEIIDDTDDTNGDVDVGLDLGNIDDDIVDDEGWRNKDLFEFGDFEEYEDVEVEVDDFPNELDFPSNTEQCNNNENHFQRCQNDRDRARRGIVNSVHDETNKNVINCASPSTVSTTSISTSHMLLCGSVICRENCVKLAVQCYSQYIQKYMKKDMHHHFSSLKDKVRELVELVKGLTLHDFSIVKEIMLIAMIQLLDGTNTTMTDYIHELCEANLSEIQVITKKVSFLNLIATIRKLSFAVDNWIIEIDEDRKTLSKLYTFHDKIMKLERMLLRLTDTNGVYNGMVKGLGKLLQLVNATNTGSTILPKKRHYSQGRKRRKKRHRSKNPYIDHYLKNEKGDDDYADLEDFIEADAEVDYDKIRYVMHTHENTISFS